jgi:hypothetical protein
MGLVEITALDVIYNIRVCIYFGKFYVLIEMGFENCGTKIHLP